MKRIIVSLVLMVAIFSCSLPDEPEGLEYFGNLQPCPVEGAYTGRVCVDEPEDGIGLWLEIVAAPDDAVDEDCMAPHLGDRVYISRNVVRRGDVGALLSFQITDLGHFPDTFPYRYIFYQNCVYYIANIKPLIITHR